MAKVPRDISEMNGILREQIGFLKTSCELYDSGNYAEGKRIANIIMILVHDGRQTKSVLSQLEIRATNPFYNTARNRITGESPPYHGLLTSQATKSKGFEFVPILDRFVGNYIQFDVWWNMPIFEGFDKMPLTRRTLISTMRDQDGGGHVDPNLDESYYSLSRNNSMGLVQNGCLNGVSISEREIPFVHLAAARQIGHEVLKSISSNYPHQVSAPCDLMMEVDAPVIVSGNGGPDVFLKMIRRVSNEQRHFDNLRFIKTLDRKCGPNESCPCGSGKKFKKCHGSLLRNSRL